MIEEIAVGDFSRKKAFGDDAVADLIRFEAVAVKRRKGADEQKKDQHGKDYDRWENNVFIQFLPARLHTIFIARYATSPGHQILLTIIAERARIDHRGRAWRWTGIMRRLVSERHAEIFGKRKGPS